MNVSFAEVRTGAVATLTLLTAPDANSFNDVGTNVVQKTVEILGATVGGTFVFELPDLSVGVLEVVGS